jgi:hypothetical protein
MTLIDAPDYDPRRDILRRNLLIALGVFIVLAIALGLGGYIAGHGWFFSNLPAEHKVDRFFTALEAQDYPRAYDIYTNGHPDSGYPLQRFTEDWTTQSPVRGPIRSHHVDISRTDGSGVFGTTIIVAVRVNGEHKVFVNVLRSDGSLTCCSATHEIEY